MRAGSWVSCPRAAPASKAAAGPGPDASFAPLPKLGAREVWFSLLAPRAWAAAGLRNPSPAELTLGLSLVSNINLPNSVEFAQKLEPGAVPGRPPAAAVIAAVWLSLVGITTSNSQLQLSIHFCNWSVVFFK